MKRYLIVAFWFSVFASSAVAQQPQGFEKGFSPEKLYHFWDIDSVNTFNGNLSLTLPIGPAYPVNGGLSYQLTLTYNSKVWDYEPVAGVHRAVPTRRSNAGMGWLVSMGRMIPPGLPTGGNSWIYESPDGRDHVTFPKLHDDDSATSFSAPITAVGYTRDGSYLRMLQYNTGIINLEFPDGTIKVFDSNSGDLLSIKDRFGNFATISHLNSIANTPCPLSDSSAWQITDSQNARTNYMCFSSQYSYPESTYPGQVDQVILAAPQGQTAVYQFGYSTTTAVDRGCHSQYPNDSPTVTVPLLTTLTLPDASTFSFTYNQHQTNGACEMGTLSSVTLPTGGQIAYGYHFYQIPTDTCSTGTWDSYITGVGTRTVSGPRIATSQWTYAQVGENLTQAFVLCENNQGAPFYKRAPSEEMIVTVTDPLGNVTEHYYSVWPLRGETLFDSNGNILPINSGDSPNGFYMPEYGLPFTRMPNSSDNGRLLSQRVYTAAGYAASPKQPLRSFYLTYERDTTSCTSGLEFNCLTSNARVNSERIIYHDDGGAASTSDSSDFDGLGQYRTVAIGGSFASGSVTTTTAYNKRDPDVNPSSGLDSGTYPGSFNLPASTDAWLLDFPSSVQHSEAGTTSILQTCYDGATGFLRARRTLKGTSRDAADLLAVFTSSGGNIATEAYYGGDIRNNSPTASTLCSSADSPPSNFDYQISHTYAFGVRATSQYSGTSFYAVNRAIDQYTGVTLSETDSALVTTNYAYDSQFRLTSISPPGLAQTTYSYFNASGSGSAFTAARVEVKTASAQGAGTVETHYQYDSVGRLWREKRRMPDDSFSLRETFYNSAGWTDSVSEFEKLVPNPTEYDFVPAHKTSYTNYDPFGRAGSVTAPDGKVSTMQYSGVRSSTRIVSVATGSSESNVPTRQAFDRQGRVISVTEADGTSNAITTSYAYDVGGRLSSVSVPVQNTSQTRLFTYDNRGFLLSEQHPENGTTNYASYDARGHVGSKTVPDTNLQCNDQLQRCFDLTYEYDAAERLIHLKSRNPYNTQAFRPLKDYTYAIANDGTNKKQGKLETATRHNYQPDIGDIAVTETYEYRDDAGRLTDKTTRIGPVSSIDKTLKQSYSYNDLGLPAQVTYPTCYDAVGCGSSIWGSVQPQYTNGLLSGIPTPAFTIGASGISYWPNRMVNVVSHGNSVADTYDIYDNSQTNGMPRPTSITFSNWTSCAAPTITTQPNGGQPIYYNDQKTLSVVASGNTPTYQWYQGQPHDTSNPIPGGTASQFTTPPLTQTTSYWVRITNSCGRIDSKGATVTVQLRAPTNLIADRSPNNPNLINVTWQAATGASFYEVWRRSGSSWGSLGTTTSLSLIDSVPSNATFFYHVTAGGSNVVNSVPSNNDLESTLSFTSVTTGTTISYAQFSELLSGVNSLRAGWGDPLFSWSDILNLSVNSCAYGTVGTTPAPGAIIYAAHVMRLRCAMDNALARAGITRPAYTDPDVTNLTIRAIHIIELQNRTDYLGDGQ